MKKLFFTLSFLSISSLAFGQSSTTNTIEGYFAGNKMTTGERNTFMGSYAGYNNTTGGKNNFIGYMAGRSNTQGAFNNFLGSGAGYTNTTGDKNVFLGAKAGHKNITGSGNVFIGYDAGYNEKGSNKLYIANSNTATPLIHGDFSAAALTVNGSLTVTGDAFKAGGGSWSVASDRRLKKDIYAFTDGLELLQKINPVRFRYNGKANMPTDKEYVGIIAQEIQKIAPYTVNTFTHKDKDGSKTEYLEYDSSALVYILVNAVKEQQQKIETLESLVAAMAKKEPDAGTLHADVNGEK